MALRRSEIDLSVERELAGEDGALRRYRLVARYRVEPPDAPTPPEELRELYRALAAELDASVPGAAARSDRPLAELIERYRPRQLELLDLLLDEREISTGEADLMRQYLQGGTLAPPAESGSLTDRPIAAAPLALDRAPAIPRTVDELLRLYQIESLRQAGAVRARRQISYEEYMALKRHFARAEESPPPAQPDATPPKG